MSFLLFSLLVTPRFGSEEPRTAETMSNYFLNFRHQFSHIPNLKTRVRKPISDSADFLANILSRRKNVILAIGNPSETAQEISQRFAKTNVELDKISKSLIAELKLAPSSKKRMDLADTAWEQVKRLLTDDAYALLRRLEVYQEGPVKFLSRNDVSKAINLSKKQRQEFEVLEKKIGALMVARKEELVADMMTTIFAELSVEKRKKFEFIIRSSQKGIAKLFNHLSEDQLRHVFRIHVPKEERGYSSAKLADDFYKERGLDLLIDLLLPERFSGKQNSKAKNEIRRIEGWNNEELAKFREKTLGKTKIIRCNPSNSDLAIGCQFVFERIVDSFASHGFELSEDQSKSFEDGKRVFGKFIPKIDSTRQSLEPFTKALLPKQKEVGLDFIILTYGPVRFLLSEPICRSLKLNESDRSTIARIATQEWNETVDQLCDDRSQYFRMVFDVLEPDQIRILRARQGASHLELSKGYGRISETLFRKDFELDQ